MRKSALCHQISKISKPASVIGANKDVIGRHGLLAVLVIGLSVWNAGCEDAGHRGSTTPSPGEAVAIEKFEVVAGYDDVTYFLEAPDFQVTRLRALQDLGAARDNDAWLILLLLAGHDGIHSLPTANPCPTVPIVTLLRRIPDNAGPAVLWALTCYLGDTETHAVSSTEVGKDGTIVDSFGYSEPVRVLVRRKLVRALAVDKEYDVVGWRAEILRRARSK